MSYESFKVLTFDVVGTLIDFETGLLTAFRRIGGAAAEGLGDDEIYAPYLVGRDLHYGRSSLVMADVYRYVAQKLNFPQTDAAARDFQLSVLEWPAFADSVEALARLRRHFRLVAMTNADRVALSAYAHTLGKPFNDAVTVDEAQYPKPDPRFFSYNLGRQSALGYAQNEILHVAQSQHHDIGVARELGYKVCWIQRRMHQEGYGGSPVPKTFTEPDFRFATLAELADAVEAERG